MTAPQVTLRNFSFPFSGKRWDTFTVGVTGSIAFAPPSTPGTHLAARSNAASVGST